MTVDTLSNHKRWLRSKEDLMAVQAALDNRTMSKDGVHNWMAFLPGFDQLDMTQKERELIDSIRTLCIANLLERG